MTREMAAACYVLPSLVAAAIAVPLLEALAHRRGPVDRANGDPLKVHEGAVPLVGGLVIACGLTVGTFVLARFPDLLAGDTVLRSLKGVLVLFCLFAVFHAIVGLVDDLRPLTPWVRLLLEVLLASSFLLLTHDGGHLERGWWEAVQPWHGVVGVAVLVGTVNAVNMQDGMDGLAVSTSMLTLAGCLIAALKSENSPVVATSLMCLLAALPFLLRNLPPAQAFLGDSGAYLLGFAVGAMAFSLGVDRAGLHGLAGILFLLGLPVLDAAAAVMRRLMLHASPFRGDRDHLYDVLARRGWSPWRVLGATCVVQALLVTCGVMLLVGGR